MRTGYASCFSTARRTLEYIARGKAVDGFTGRLEGLVAEARRNAHWRTEYMTLEMIKQEERREGIAIGFDEGVAVGEERGIAIGRDEGIVIGAENRSLETARSMLAEGFPVEQTARLTGLSLERVRRLADEEPEKGL